MIRIESINNKTVKNIASLKQKKYRDKTGLFIAEGERNVRDGALKQTPEAIFVSDGFGGDIEYPCDIYSVTKEVFEKISDTGTPQGILGVFKKKTVDINSFSDENILILNGVSDPGNAGTLMRTALAFGYSSVIADRGCADLYGTKSVRAAMSAVFGLKICISDNLTEDLKILKEKGYHIYCADMDGKDIRKTDFEFPLGVIVGNEANGVDGDVISLSEKKVSIPMNKEMESLNAAVAGSLVMYDSTRKIIGCKL